MMQPFTRDINRGRQLEAAFLIQRRGMAVLAFLFPVIFLVSSFVLGRTDFQTSLSAYYWTLDPERNFFVGVLCAVAVFFLLYKGYNWKEDRILDLAGLAAVGVAFFPMDRAGDCTSSGVSIHGVCAVIFFACIFYVCVFMSEHSLGEIADETRRSWFRRVYRICAGIMITCVAIAVGSRYLPENIVVRLCENSIIFWIESFSIWAFAVFWHVKTREIDPSLSMIPFRKKSESQV